MRKVVVSILLILILLALKASTSSFERIDFVLQFGEKGKGEGQFNHPSYLALDEEGNIYITDTANNRVEVFDSSGNFLKAFGKKGSKESEFKEPAGIIVTKEGKILVADRGNNRIQVFNQEGEFLAKFGEKGKGEREFNRPVGLCLGREGVLYVADSGNYRIQVFSSDGIFLRAFGSKGKGEGQFLCPVDVGEDSKGNIYVLDKETSSLQRFDRQGKFLEKLGEGGFSNPEGITVSKSDFIYLSDSGNSKVREIDSSFKISGSFGTKGEGPSQVKDLRGIKAGPKGKVYLIDSGNNRVQVFKLGWSISTPADLKAEGEKDEIKLTWSENKEPYLLGYKVYRSHEEGGDYKEIAKLRETTYLDQHLERGTTYYYYITAQSESEDESSPTGIVSAATSPLAPDTPTGLKAEAEEKQIKLSWDANKESYLELYIVYRQEADTGEYKKIAETKEISFLDTNLKSDTTYYYKVSAQAKEGEESEKSSAVQATTLKVIVSGPLLEIAKIEIAPVFSANYKYYVDNPIGTITIKNNSEMTFPKVKLSFSIQNFMDYSSDTIIPEVLPQEIKEIPLMAIFNNKILEVAEDTPIQAEVKVTYYKEGEEKIITLNKPFTLYCRNAMTWDEKGKLAIFITPKDPLLLQFARGVIQQYQADTSLIPLNQNLLLAREAFDALGIYGITYLPDPNNPYEKVSEDVSLVDYIQYPRETLKRKSGDCDDCVNLFSACLENIGINTSLIDIPGHIFMIFDTGIEEEDSPDFGFPPDSYLIYEGNIWIPVETTMFGSSFKEAWEKGAKEYQEWKYDERLEIIDLRQAWERYKPATLPPTEWEVEVPSKEKIEKKFAQEVEDLTALRLENLSQRYKTILAGNPRDLNALSQLGILYAENKRYGEALAQFSKILEIDFNNASAFNNMGNIFYLQGELEKALTSYEAAAKLDPDDAGILINLSTIYYQKGILGQAREKFKEAVEKDPSLEIEYSELCAELREGE